MTHCDKHPYDEAAKTCAACRRGFCENCLIWPDHHRDLAYCIACALAKAGVRASAARSPVAQSRRWWVRRAKVA